MYTEQRRVFYNKWFLRRDMTSSCNDNYGNNDNNYDEMMVMSIVVATGNLSTLFWQDFILPIRDCYNLSFLFAMTSLKSKSFQHKKFSTNNEIGKS